MKTGELRALPEQELLREYEDRMKELFNLRCVVLEPARDGL